MSKNKIYISGIVHALAQGIYDGDETMATLLSHGSLGIGTFNAVDGEMVVDDHQCYQIQSDGKLQNVMNLEQKSPWAMMTHLEAEKIVQLKEIDSLSGIDQALNEHLFSTNYFHAIRMKGAFHTIRYRSACPQTKPYQPMYKTMPGLQKEFTVEHIENAVVIAFFTPDYFSSVSVMGYHYHFYDKSLNIGGHILDAHLKEVSVELAKSLEVTTHFTNTPEFKTVKMDADVNEKLMRVEKAR